MNPGLVGTDTPVRTVGQRIRVPDGRWGPVDQVGQTVRVEVRTANGTQVKHFTREDLGRNEDRRTKGVDDGGRKMPNLQR